MFRYAASMSSDATLVPGGAFAIFGICQRVRRIKTGLRVLVSPAGHRARVLPTHALVRVVIARGSRINSSLSSCAALRLLCAYRDTVFLARVADPDLWRSKISLRAIETLAAIALAIRFSSR